MLMIFGVIVSNYPEEFLILLHFHIQVESVTCLVVVVVSKNDWYWHDPSCAHLLKGGKLKLYLTSAPFSIKYVLFAIVFLNLDRYHLARRVWHSGKFFMPIFEAAHRYRVGCLAIDELLLLGLGGRGCSWAIPPSLTTLDYVRADILKVLWRSALILTHTSKIIVSTLKNLHFLRFLVKIG